MSSSTIKLEMLLIVFSLSLITLVTSQYQCDKYCHQDCPEPDLLNNDFSDCVDAHNYCSCGLLASDKILLSIFGAVVGIAIITCCWAALKRKIMKRKITRGRIYFNNIAINTTSVAQTVRPRPYRPAHAHKPAFTFAASEPIYSSGDDFLSTAPTTYDYSNEAASAPIYSSGDSFLSTAPTTYDYSNGAGPPCYDQAIMIYDSMPCPSHHDTSCHHDTS